MHHVARITIYPIKSLDGVSLTACDVLPQGALRNDRRWAIVDELEKFVNGKRSSAVHEIRAVFDLANETVSLGRSMDCLTSPLHLSRQRDEVNRWLSDALDMPVHLIESTHGGFPDDTQRPGPTVVSTGTLNTTVRWFPGVDLESARLRFRANIEVDSPEAFWEDRLVGNDDQHPIRFRVGEVAFEGLGISQRCVVPSRHPRSGEVISGFAKRFSRLRGETLPLWSPRQRFDHFYRLAVNTRRVETGASAKIRVGDSLVIGS